MTAAPPQSVHRKSNASSVYFTFPLNSFKHKIKFTLWLHIRFGSSFIIDTRKKNENDYKLKLLILTCRMSS